MIGRRLPLAVIFGHTDEPPVYNFEHEYAFDLASGRFEKTMKKASPASTR
jgi:hypothetical protein